LGFKRLNMKSPSNSTNSLRRLPNVSFPHKEFSEKFESEGTVTNSRDDTLTTATSTPPRRVLPNCLNRHRARRGPSYSSQRKHSPGCSTTPRITGLIRVTARHHAPSHHSSLLLKEMCKFFIVLCTGMSQGMKLWFNQSILSECKSI